MTRSHRRDPAVVYLSQLTALVDQHGWAVQGVMCGGPGHPEFAYTVGLFRLDAPEFIIFGAPFDPATDVLNGLAERVRDGVRYVHGQIVVDVARMPVMLLKVADTTQHLLMAHSLARPTPGARRRLRAWQVVYPDDDMRWPWQPGCAVPDLPILGLVPEGV